MTEVVTPICVLFVGSSSPTREWLRTKAKPLCVRREKVRAALLWLKQHNPLYTNITIDFDVINSLEDEQIPPFHIEHVMPNDAVDSLTSRYDMNAFEGDLPNEICDLPFQNVVITDVDAHAPSHELRAAALRHIKDKKGGYIQIPHDPKPVNEFFNPELLPRIYPTLFPYGIGGPEDPQRNQPLSFIRHVKHLFNLHDRRFQEHYSFLFTTFNIIQHRNVLLNTSLKVKKASFEHLATAFGTVTPEVVHIVSERVSRGDFSTIHNSEEKKVVDLLKQVKAVTHNTPGSSSSKLVMRNEIRAMMIDKGMPSFYITINPADVYNPVVKFLAGNEINIDNLLSEQVPNYREQSILVAKNPVIAAKFFNIYMKAFISTILGYDTKGHNLKGGILGLVKAYYGCVEAQGRGTLHCHMLIWIEGALNPNEIKKKVVKDGDLDFQRRLLAFLDDTISNCIPNDPDPLLKVPSSIHHPCSVRGSFTTSTNANLNEKMYQKDLYHLVSQCQVHRHTHTCYKYWKGPPEPKICRFGLSEDNVRSKSEFDPSTGELCLRCLNGLVNNFNETMLRAMRCNMDIKFIGSGAAAKAMIFYITDYITKSQLKAHIAYAALDLAIKKLGEYDPNEDEVTHRAKRLLQRCAYALLSHQELSAPQVASYVTGLEDHFTSHCYRNLYWTTFEKWVDRQDPLSNSHHISSESCTLQHDCSTTNIIAETDSSHTMENDETENIVENPDADEDLTIAFTDSGHLIAKSNQVADYVLRGQQLEHLCLWDFVSQIDKITKKSTSKINQTISMTYDDPSDIDEDMEQEDNIESGIKYQKINAKARIHVPLMNDHQEASSHVLQLRLPSMYFIPVPIGPSLPRRDQSDNYERYCRLMLILFKPWRKCEDLRPRELSWNQTFEDFVTSSECDISIRKKLDNMQVLHECKDSCDDHFLQRQKERSRYNKEMINRTNNTALSDTDDLGTMDDDFPAVLDHLESIQKCTSLYAAKTNESLADCLLSIDQSGMFNISQNDYAWQVTTENPTTNAHCIDISHEITNIPDDEIWKTAYEKRRDDWKRKNQESPENPTKIDNKNTMNDSHDFRNAHNMEPIHPMIHSD